jgi:hypothetical protein
MAESGAQWHYLKLPSPACGGRLGWGLIDSAPSPRPRRAEQDSVGFSQWMRPRSGMQAPDDRVLMCASTVASP